MYLHVVTEEEDVAWLRALDSELWPPGHKNAVHGLQASRPLTEEEMARVLRCIEDYKLVTEMHTTTMFGGYGMKVYDNPAAPGVPLVPVLFLIEDHLPLPSRWALVDENRPAASTRSQGIGRTDAWELFSRYTHSEQNRKWLAHFKLKASRDRTYYDY